MYASRASSRRGVLSLAASLALAQSYPSRPLRMSSGRRPAARRIWRKTSETYVMPARMRWQENPRAAGFRVHCVSRTTLKAGVGLRNPLEAELADGRQALFAPSKRAGGLGAAALTRPARQPSDRRPPPSLSRARLGRR
jgi:hypothetical protein